MVEETPQINPVDPDPGPITSANGTGSPWQTNGVVSKPSFTPAEMTRLIAIFPGGVCDWSKPGVNQTPVVTWASLGPSPKNLIFSLAAPRDSSR